MDDFFHKYPDAKSLLLQMGVNLANIGNPEGSQMGRTRDSLSVILQRLSRMGAGTFPEQLNFYKTSQYLKRHLELIPNESFFS